jgi:hypothetical protein
MRRLIKDLFLIFLDPVFDLLIVAVLVALAFASRGVP